MAKSTTKMMTVITTARGTLGPEGITQPGEKVTIPVASYSKNWMRPATAADAALVGESAVSNSDTDETDASTTADADTTKTAAAAGDAAGTKASGEQTS